MIKSQICSLLVYIIKVRVGETQAPVCWIWVVWRSFLQWTEQRDHLLARGEDCYFVQLAFPCSAGSVSRVVGWEGCGEGGYTLHYAGKLPCQTRVHYSDLMITFHICRLKAKGSSAKRGRRITLTPLPSQPASSNHFSSTNSPDNCWKTNPAFTNYFTSSEKPTSLSEEKRLLQLERSKRRQIWQQICIN